jgi:hypothetical protein
MKVFRLVVLAAVLMTGCGRQLEAPPRVEPPAGGEADIGVAYGVTVFCRVPIELGGMWWSFVEPDRPWPPDISIPPFPFSIWATVSNPYAVPGIVTLATPTRAVFRADVDGSEFALGGHEENPHAGSLC